MIQNIFCKDHGLGMSRKCTALNVSFPPHKKREMAVHFGTVLLYDFKSKYKFVYNFNKEFLRKIAIVLFALEIYNLKSLCFTSCSFLVSVVMCDVRIR